MVLFWIITVVSPRWMLLEVVVIVRVTLQLVSTVAAPMITRATIVPIIFRINDFIVMRFFCLSADFGGMYGIFLSVVSVCSALNLFFLSAGSVKSALNLLILYP